MSALDQKIEMAADWIRSADALLITAGAGMGIDSGLPDFRGPGGFWRVYPGLGRSNIGFYDIASPAAFKKDPRQAWGFYGHRLQMYRKTQPHEGFAILQDFGKRMRYGTFVFTSNVDGQFSKAGFDEKQLVECHGSIHYLQCLDNCSSRIWRDDAFEPVVDELACRLLSALPTCPDCGNLARPNILMFDDWNWQPMRTEVQEFQFAAWREKARNLVVIELGAGTTIPSVRRKGENQRGKLIRINPHESSVGRDEAIGIASGALSTLKALQAYVT